MLSVQWNRGDALICLLLGRFFGCKIQESGDLTQFAHAAQIVGMLQDVAHVTAAQPFKRLCGMSDMCCDAIVSCRV